MNLFSSKSKPDERLISEFCALLCEYFVVDESIAQKWIIHKDNTVTIKLPFAIESQHSIVIDWIKHE